MESSVPNFAKGVYSTLRESFIQSRSAYMQMEQESEDEENGRDMSHSLFYSVQQHNDELGEDSIPLTDSHGYSDRSQLLFDNETTDDSQHDVERPTWKDDSKNRPVCYLLLYYFFSQVYPSLLCMNGVKYTDSLLLIGSSNDDIFGSRQ